jgi:hypothetical protein
VQESRNKELPVTFKVVSLTGTQRGLRLAQKDSFVDEVENLKRNGTEFFFHGGCVGADELMHIIVNSYGYSLDKLIVWPSNIIRKQARLTGQFTLMPADDPLKRNKKLVDMCDFLVACPGEQAEVLRSGTWMTIRYARSLKRKHVIIYPDGKVERHDSIR